MVAGDDDWYVKKAFQYEPDSTVTIGIRKYGGVRNGDVDLDFPKP